MSSILRQRKLLHKFQSALPADVDKAVSAARSAFKSWSLSSKAERLELMESIKEIYTKRYNDMAGVISQEVGAPITMSTAMQAGTGSAHIQAFIDALRDFDFEHPQNADGSGDYLIHTPIGVCGLITPWNWPMNQTMLKVMPAIATGCASILKPSEVSPMSGMLFAEIMDEAGVPAGVFNLVNGDGVGVGSAMSAHPEIDMISFTGSTRAGKLISKSAADTIKRVTLELGGKGPNIVFEDSDIQASVTRGTLHVFNNTGQSCNAPTRMLVEESVYEDAVKIAGAAAESTSVGDPSSEGKHIGPVISQAQFDKVQGLIQAGIDEGARLVAGGVGRPDGLNRGYYVKPTVFADVTNDMQIAQEEIFGPVMCMIPFKDEDNAVDIANDTPYGLTSYVQSGDKDRANRLARQLNAGMVIMNGAGRAPGSPFGGMKQSGNGREGGKWGLEDYLEIKAVSGWTPEA